MNIFNKLSIVSTVSIVSALFVAAGCSKAASKSAATPSATLVTAAKPVPDATIDHVAVVQGTLRTKFSALVAARIPGTIDSIFVEEGVSVTNGTPLFQVDRRTVENAFRAAGDDLAIAKAKLGEANAALEKAALDDARMVKLVADRAVTKDTAEKAALQHKIASASVASAQALVTKAESGLAIAQKNLSDSLIVAPFDGIVTRKLKDAGDYVGAGVPVFMMENPSIYEITISMNADNYDLVTEGKTQVRLSSPASLKGKLFTVTYKAPSVHPVTRTFEIRATVPKTADLATGMILDGEVVFGTRKTLAVPSAAIALRDGKWTVFAVKDGKAEAITVTKGAEWNGMVEVLDVSAGFADDQIVTEGMLLLNPGDAVRLQ